MKILKSKITKAELDLLQLAAGRHQAANTQLTQLKTQIDQANSIFLQANGALEFMKGVLIDKYKMEGGDSISFDDGAILRTAHEITKMIEA